MGIDMYPAQRGRLSMTAHPLSQTAVTHKAEDSEAAANSQDPQGE